MLGCVGFCKPMATIFQWVTFDDFGCQNPFLRFSFSLWPDGEHKKDGETLLFAAPIKWGVVSMEVL